MERSAKSVGLIVAVEMFAVFEGWGRPDEVYDGLMFKLCRYDMYGHHVFVVRSGPGQENAESAACMIVEKFGVQELWNFGVAGGLTPEALVGDVFVVDEVVRWDAEADGAKRGRYLLDGNSGSCRVDVAAGAGCDERARAGRRARLASGNSVVSARQARKWLANYTGADIVDMEAAGIAAAAVKYGLPCFVIKCVSDDINTDKSMLTENFRKTACTAFAAFDIIFRNS